ncbi:MULTISPECIES: flagellar hook capping FlgD N-terminal domain-containing protein [unclassified Sphingomonas]|uniref:flagellar hook assembly protein FlgD n=1 Tax=unclassified Sphingomonas TaxID=196159 RepID=UPI001F580C55|nr:MULTISPECIES: flagellar hook capping FlgD N-terminal domain-containing protein [unclassified Sphingomonas]
MTSTTMASTLSSLGIATTASAAATAGAAANKTSQTLDQSDFLTLMTAQLKNQDPFNPVDNTQMIAQMAQMSSVTGISQMNTTLTGIATKLGATSATDAMNYVGKTVLTEGSTAYGRTAGGIAGAVELDGAATNVDVTIADAKGNVLKTVSLGAQSAGTATYDWDGTTDAGASAGTGPFKVTVAADDNGTTVTSRSLVWAPVESVSLPSSGDPTLTATGIGTVKLSAIRSVG